MGKASSGKKVARAASTGGGRTSRGKTPWGWYSAIALVVVLGIVVVAMSREQTLDRVEGASADQPTTKDHWHSAYGFFFCDQFSPPLANNNRDPLGIHTHGDGVVHVHPFTRAAAGKNAKFGVFERTMGITLSKTRLEIGDRKYSNGDKCGDKRGVVQVFVDGQKFDGDPSDIHFSKDRQAIVIAFAPEGTDIPKTPPSFSQLNNLEDVQGRQAPGNVDNQATTSSSAPAGGGGETTSSVPGTSPSSTP